MGSGWMTPAELIAEARKPSSWMDWRSLSIALADALEAALADSEKTEAA
jgi:hypothetical protein